MSDRPHGTYASYKLSGCRCFPCSNARFRYDIRRQMLISQGKWQPYVDAAEARAHVELLRAAGLGTRQVAALAGCNRKAMQNVLNGTVQRVRPETHAAILAVPLDAPKPDKALVDATAARRMVQGLAAVGWSITKQAEARGQLVSNQLRLTGAESVTAATEREIFDLYDRWSMRPPPDTWQVRRSKALASRNLWFPPLAWDDDTIGDPDALPVLLLPVKPVDRDLELAVQHVVAGHQVEVSAEARREIVRRLPKASRAEVARLARCHVKTVTELRRRAA